MKEKDTLVAGALFLAFLMMNSVAIASFFGDEPAPWEKRLPFDSATIEYRISGMQSGTRTTYVKGHGKYEASYEKLSMHIMGMTRKTERVEITTPDWIYDIDLVERTGTRIVNPVKYMMEEYNRLSSADKKKVLENAKKMGAAIMNGMNGAVKYKAAKIMGYTCDVTSMQGIRIYTIEGTGFPLKTESNMMGMKHAEEAVSIKKGPIPDKKFQPPAGIHLEVSPEADKMAREQARMMIQSLVQGKPMADMPRRGGMAPHGASSAVPSPASHDGGAQQPDMTQFMKQLQGMMEGK